MFFSCESRARSPARSSRVYRLIHTSNHGWSAFVLTMPGFSTHRTRYLSFLCTSLNWERNSEMFPYIPVGLFFGHCINNHIFTQWYREWDSLVVARKCVHVWDIFFFRHIKYIINNQFILFSRLFSRLRIHHRAGTEIFANVQQFFKHNFPIRHSATTKRNIYRSCLVCDTCIRELIVLDVPLQVRQFDINSVTTHTHSTNT